MGNKKTIIKYKASEKGKGNMMEILEPYEVLFPWENVEKQ